jgi:hypothetical protein
MATNKKGNWQSSGPQNTTQKPKYLARRTLTQTWVIYVNPPAQAYHDIY